MFQLIVIVVVGVGVKARQEQRRDCNDICVQILQTFAYSKHRLRIGGGNSAFTL